MSFRLRSKSSTGSSTCQSRSTEQAHVGHRLVEAGVGGDDQTLVFGENEVGLGDTREAVDVPLVTMSA